MILYTAILEAESQGAQLKAVTVIADGGNAQVCRITETDGRVWFSYKTSLDEAIRTLWREHDTLSSVTCDEQEYHDLFAKMAIHNREHF